MLRSVLRPENGPFKRAAITQIHKRFVTQYLSNFQQGDIVILRGVLRPDRVSLSKPLTPGTSWQTPFGHFRHDDLIGKEPRAVVVNTKGDKFIVTHSTLEDYMVNRRRLAQPIYPYDAAAIVSLADIHVDPLSEQETGAPTLHFMEAGTGHGSLTLAICKSIHAANPKGSPPGAILHSIDRNKDHSKLGKKNVEQFRRGMYLRDVEFHVANTPSSWVEQAGVKLSGVFLDLPQPNDSIKTIAKHMRVDAPLVVFCPSITQIQEIVNEIAADASIPLVTVDVVELMPGMGGSMRSWDVRSAKIKETGKIGAVCRPRVGSKVVGGGFIGMFRKLPDDARPPAQPEPQTEDRSWSAWVSSLLTKR